MSENNGRQHPDSRQYLLNILADNRQINQEQWLPILAKCFIESEDRHEQLYNRLFGNERLHQTGFVEDINNEIKSLEKQIADLDTKINPIARFHKNVLKTATILSGPIMVFFGWLGAWIKEHFKH